MQPTVSTSQPINSIPQPVTLMSEAHPVPSAPESVPPNPQQATSNLRQDVEQEPNEPIAAPRKSSADREAAIALQPQQTEDFYNANKPKIEDACASLGFGKNEPNWRKVRIWQANKRPTARPTTTAAPRPLQDQKLKPDQIEHPGDGTKVPKYPVDDINAYEKRSGHHEVYLCRHEKNTGKDCCTNGLTRSKMVNSIRKEISTWKAKVELLIFNKGLLDECHKTWYTFNNPKLRDKQKMEEAKEREKKEKEEDREHRRMLEVDKADRKEQESLADERVRYEEQEETRQRKQQGQEQRVELEQQNAEASVSELDVAERPIKQEDACAYEPNDERTAEQAAQEDAHSEEMKTKLRLHERRHREAFNREQRKKWPNWDLFNAWWQAQRLKALNSLLSTDEKNLLNTGEP
jgi:hypothetical protein